VKIVLLHDEVPPTARADELDVFVQAEAIEAVLAELGHTAVRHAFSSNLAAQVDALRALAPDLVFNLVESVGGHGGLLHLAPALLDALRIPYTGAATGPMLVTTSKVLTKQWLRAHGLPTPDWCGADPTAGPRPTLPGRFIVKAVWEEASVGLDDEAVVMAAGFSDLLRALEERSPRWGGEGFAEAYIEGREFNLSVLGGPQGPEVLPPAEIEFTDYDADKPRIVGYRAKWDNDSFEYQHTTRRFDFPAADGDLLQHLTSLARRCWTVFGLRGYARVDFRVDETGRPWILEINANPCLSPDAGFPAAAARAGLTYTCMIARILDDTMPLLTGKATASAVEASDAPPPPGQGGSGETFPRSATPLEAILSPTADNSRRPCPRSTRTTAPRI